CVVAPRCRRQARGSEPRAGSETAVGQVLARGCLRELGIRAAVVENAPPYREAEPGPVGRPIRLVHSGNARRNRNLELMIEAVEAADADVSLDLYLMPNDPAYLEQLCARARDS